jgi:hypothetical protein
MEGNRVQREESVSILLHFIFPFLFFHSLFLTLHIFFYLMGCESLYLLKILAKDHKKAILVSTFLRKLVYTFGLDFEKAQTLTTYQLSYTFSIFSPTLSLFFRLCFLYFFTYTFSIFLPTHLNCMILTDKGTLFREGRIHHLSSHKK